jgi:tRNA-dihydrouridine synthase A
VHARKAWLQGLSPKQNREIPPLKYDYVHRLKKEKPSLRIVINGGIKSMDVSQQQLEHVDGVMIGREAYYNPYILANVDQDIYGDKDAVQKNRKEIVYQLCDYIDHEVANGTELHSMTRHILGLYHACPGARLWRRHLSEQAHLPGADSSVLKAALAHVES